MRLCLRSSTHITLKTTPPRVNELLEPFAAVFERVCGVILILSDKMFIYWRASLFDSNQPATALFFLELEAQCLTFSDI